MPQSATGPSFIVSPKNGKIASQEIFSLADEGFNVIGLLQTGLEAFYFSEGAAQFSLQIF